MPSAKGLIKSKKILGVPVATLGLGEIPKVIINNIKVGGKKQFFYVNAHCLTLAQKDKEYLSILKRADLVYSGGMGPVLASRILLRPLPERTPTPDFIDQVFEAGEDKNWTFYFLGAELRSLEKAVKKIKQKFPRLAVVGYHHGYFDEGEERKIIADINRKRPTVLIVGMGMPKQEKWIAKNMGKINAGVFWSVGALFDIISGKMSRGPVWMQKVGLEWLFRLYQEPKRLWKRYTLGNIYFVYLIFKAKFYK